MAEEGARRGPTNSLFNNVYVPDEILTFPLTVAPATEDVSATVVMTGNALEEISLETTSNDQGYINAPPTPNPLNATSSNEIPNNSAYISLFNAKSDNRLDVFDSILKNSPQPAPPAPPPPIFVPASVPQPSQLEYTENTSGNMTQLWSNPPTAPYTAQAFAPPVNAPVQNPGQAQMPLYFTPSTAEAPSVMTVPGVASGNVQQESTPVSFRTTDPRPEIPQIPAGGNSNNFRLNKQKLVYAQYPGLVSPSAPLMDNGIQAQGPFPSPQPNTQNWGNPEYVASVSQPPAPLVYTPPPPSAVVYGDENNPVITEEMPYSFGTVPPPFQPHEPPVYKPVGHHWFARRNGAAWKPFSAVDSAALENAFQLNSQDPVPVEGGRFDVDVIKRVCSPVYWEDTEPTNVQRCSWFYKGPMDSHFLPYSEEVCARLEEEYAHLVEVNIWDKRLEFGGGEAVVFHNPNVVFHYCPQASADEWGNLPENQLRPRVVKRGIEGVPISNGESAEIAHLVFLVHGIGSFCDFKFRTVVETVDDFRTLSAQLLQTHFKDAKGRVEFLPVQWHKALHGDGGIDDKLKPITLKSIPKLRHFTNDTLLDILFYTSPVYCQTIMDTVGTEMNRMFNLFLQRNPTFNSTSVAVAGHSLGSLILFDLLTHQPKLLQPISTAKRPSAENLTTQDPIPLNISPSPNSGLVEQSSRMVSYTVGTVGTGHPYINYPVLKFHPTAFFALGSPIAMFVTVRGLDNLGKDFRFPTCPAFFNIFHPFDPVAYRIENLIDPALDLRPVLVPHHKGRKRFHLELKETMARVGADFKHKVMESLRMTWNTVSQLTNFNVAEPAVDNAIAAEEFQTVEEVQSDREEKAIQMGSLNGGRRVDYVLQEAPHQILNEYLFALSSHVCYWESDDTVLLIMNEIINQGQSPSPSPDPTSTQTAEWSIPAPAQSQPCSKSFDPNTQDSFGQAPSTFVQTPGPPPTQGFL